MILTKAGRAALLVVTVLATTGCGRKPAPAPVVIRLTKGGLPTVDGEGLVPEDLRALLKARAEASPRDADGLPTVSVVISADAGCEYRHVQDAMVQCMRAYVWRVSWEMDGRRVDASLPKDCDDGGWIGESEMEFETPVFVHEEAEAMAPAAPKGGPAPPLEPVAGRRMCSVRPKNAAGVYVSLHWVNGDDRVIYSPTSAFPPEWPGLHFPLSTDGARVSMSVNRKPCGGLDGLRASIGVVAAQGQEVYVRIQASAAIPFGQVFRVLDACRKARVRAVYFEWPSPGTDDWWWL